MLYGAQTDNKLVLFDTRLRNAMLSPANSSENQTSFIYF